MRSDLARCTTEQPRAGRGLAKASKRKYGGRVRIVHDSEHDYENEWGGFKSSAPSRHKEPKSFTDSLGALRGNLRKAVGRRWDEIYSEFCRHHDRRGLAGYHLWTHLMDEVKIRTFMQNGKVYEFSGYPGPRPVNGFYVHPKTGILKYSPWPRLRTKEKSPRSTNNQIGPNQAPQQS
jgi:hypothetical protein